MEKVAPSSLRLLKDEARLSGESLARGENLYGNYRSILRDVYVDTVRKFDSLPIFSTSEFDVEDVLVLVI